MRTAQLCTRQLRHGSVEIGGEGEVQAHRQPADQLQRWRRQKHSPLQRLETPPQRCDPTPVAHWRRCVARQVASAAEGEQLSSEGAKAGPMGA